MKTISLPDFSCGVEILVHNLSHSDIVLGIDRNIENQNGTLPTVNAFARPKFSSFRSITRDIYHTASNNSDSLAGKSLPATYRSHSDEWSVPIGFELGKFKIATSMSSLRFRRDDKSLINCISEQDVSSCNIDTVYFPLVSLIMKQWLDSIQPSFVKLVFLISGVGSPMNPELRTIDNSTKYAARLMTLFLEKHYPDVIVCHVHSNSNLFRFDENIDFVRQDFMSHIHSIRNQLAVRHGAEWKKYMHVSLSFADGSSARISAIQTALKYYRPDYFHFWQLKTFWSEEKLILDDIEWHSFEEMSMAPARDAMTLENANMMLVFEEMQRFRQEFEKMVFNSSSLEDRLGFAPDLSAFWLRKTKKPVLAVLLVQKPNEEPRLYRGTNMEVSMPTGSLCAERNVIGTALAADLSLRREHLKLIAVYSAPHLDRKRRMSVSTSEISHNIKQFKPEAALGDIDNDLAPNGASDGYFLGETASPHDSVIVDLCSNGLVSGQSMAISTSLPVHLGNNLASGIPSPFGSPSSPSATVKTKRLWANSHSHPLPPASVTVQSPSNASTPLKTISFPTSATTATTTTTATTGALKLTGGGESNNASLSSSNSCRNIHFLSSRKSYHSLSPMRSASPVGDEMTALIPGSDSSKDLLSQSNSKLDRNVSWSSSLSNENLNSMDDPTHGQFVDAEIFVSGSTHSNQHYISIDGDFYDAPSSPKLMLPSQRKRYPTPLHASSEHLSHSTRY